MSTQPLGTVSSDEQVITPDDDIDSTKPSKGGTAGGAEQDKRLTQAAFRLSMQQKLSPVRLTQPACKEIRVTC